MLLVQQLTDPVRWEDSVAGMAADGASVFVEIGPGKVLQGLVKRICSTVATEGVETLNDISVRNEHRV